jgi:hypothetical protein
MTNEFASGGKTTVPIEIDAYKLEGGKEVKIYNTNGFFVVSNRNELGYGPDPNYIKGAAYSKFSPSLARGVSNVIEYNYLTFDKRGFEKITGLKLRMDSYTQSKMTEDHYRLLIDFAFSMPEAARKDIGTIFLARSTGANGGYADGSGIHIPLARLPGIEKVMSLRHEAIHRHHFALSDQGSQFNSEWRSVEGPYTPGGGYRLSTFSGPNYGFAWGYGSQDNYEDKSTFGDQIYNPNYWKNLLADSNKYNSIYRGKLALLYKYQFITEGEYNAAFAAAGLTAGRDSAQNYINQAKSKWSRT